MVIDILKDKVASHQESKSESKKNKLIEELKQSLAQEHKKVATANDKLQNA